MLPPHGQPGSSGLDPTQAEPPAPSRARALLASELALDKLIDFVLIFVGLYAATAVQRCQDTAKEKDEYVAVLRDFKGELRANLEQEAAIEKDLGEVEHVTPGSNLGPMKDTFDRFFAQLAEDEKVVACLHEEFAASTHAEGPRAKEECHALYKSFDAAHASHETKFNFRPVVLTPFYRYEVWQLYIADGIKTFRNKDLAVKIGEVYNNARLIEKHVADIETTYNDAFLKQVGRSAATDMELAEVVHDEEREHALSEQNQTRLIRISEAVKDEHYATTEVLHILELKTERMKGIVLVMRAEIEAINAAIDEELKALGAEAATATE
jgi:hypothetical protein